MQVPKFWLLMSTPPLTILKEWMLQVTNLQWNSNQYQPLRDELALQGSLLYVDLILATHMRDQDTSSPMALILLFTTDFQFVFNFLKVMVIDDCLITVPFSLDLVPTFLFMKPSSRCYQIYLKTSSPILILAHKWLSFWLFSTN